MNMIGLHTIVVILPVCADNILCLFLRLIPTPERESFLKKVCSWCGIVIYTGSVPDAVITHSICAICVAKIEEQMAEAERAKDATRTEK